MLGSEIGVDAYEKDWKDAGMPHEEVVAEFVDSEEKE